MDRFYVHGYVRRISGFSHVMETSAASVNESASKKLGFACLFAQKGGSETFFEKYWVKREEPVAGM
jgi:hypothetical protein